MSSKYSGGPLLKTTAQFDLNPNMRTQLDKPRWGSLYKSTDMDFLTKCQCPEKLKKKKKSGPFWNKGDLGDMTSKTKQTIKQQQKGDLRCMTSKTIQFWDHRVPLSSLLVHKELVAQYPLRSRNKV